MVSLVSSMINDYFKKTLKIKMNRISKVVFKLWPREIEIKFSYIIYRVAD